MDWCESCYAIFCVSCTVEGIKTCTLLGTQKGTRRCNFIRCKDCAGDELKSCIICYNVTCEFCAGTGHCFGCNTYICDEVGCATKYGCVNCGKKFCSTCEGRFLTACENNCSYYSCNECNDV
jgi:hypothetical protein